MRITDAVGNPIDGSVMTPDDVRHIRSAALDWLDDPAERARCRELRRIRKQREAEAFQYQARVLTEILMLEPETILEARNDEQFRRAQHAMCRALRARRKERERLAAAAPPSAEPGISAEEAKARTALLMSEQ